MVAALTRKILHSYLRIMRQANSLTPKTSFASARWDSGVKPWHRLEASHVSSFNLARLAEKLARKSRATAGKYRNAELGTVVLERELRSATCSSAHRSGASF